MLDIEQLPAYTQGSHGDLQTLGSLTVNMREWNKVNVHTVCMKYQALVLFNSPYTLMKSNLKACLVIP